jgi:pimeloyl-ACP methyl ester carboxylesterase
VSHGQGGELRIKAPDGRSLAVEISGAANGTPVFLLHGTPGSRNGPKPRGSVLYRLGVRLIAYDRPGYGGSDRHRGRSVADAAADVAAIAEGLGLDRFAVVGRSGGGPHALACAALLGARVTRTAVLVGVAPADADGLDWFGGMTEDNVEEYSTADADAALLTERLRLRAEVVARDPETLIETLVPQMTASDRRVVSDVAIRRLLTDTYTEGLRSGPYGWIDDVFAFRGGWCFSFEDIQGPVLLWHGADDNFSPVSHTHWMAKRIPHAETHVQENSAHFGAVEILPDLLSWLVGRQLDPMAGAGNVSLTTSTVDDTPR